MTRDKMSHYEILDKLGQGGMGIVYKARDPRLVRIVALKVLPPGDFADVSRKDRLIQEARSASALNHPNIVTIHDIGEEDGQPFIAMEFVAGRTLGQLIPRRGMKVDEVLRLGVQIADALSAAHYAGIIHRDLKPGNVMVTESGLVKVLDFGLAKIESGSSSSDEETRTRLVETGEGWIVGTVAYMSPEQAEGKPLDARSDIFSLGVMLYEMLTGQRPFTGDTPMSTAAAILNQEPAPLKCDGEDLPPEISRVVMRCLRKDPNRRFQNMADLKVALAELQEESESGKLTSGASPLRPSRRRLRVLEYSGAGLVLLLLAGASFWPKKPVATHQTPVRITRDGSSNFPKLSRDGKLIAYQSLSGGDKSHIWVRQTAGGEAMQVTKGGDDDWEPDFSPDGTRIAFRSDRDGGGIYIAPTFGGEPRLLVKGGGRPAFSPDGIDVLYLTKPLFQDGSLFVIPATGGAPREVCPDWFAFGSAFWSPDGKTILFLGRRKSQQDLRYTWQLVSAGGGDPREFAFPADANAHVGDRDVHAWTRNHQDRESIIYSSGTGDSRNLFRFSVSSTGTAQGPEEQLTFGTGLVDGANISPDGQLVFGSGEITGQVWVTPIDVDQAMKTGEAQQVTRSEGILHDNPAISRDGRWLAYRAINAATSEGIIRLRDLTKGTERELVSKRGPKGTVSISPDGSQVAYQAFVEKEWTAFVVAVSGGTPVRLCSQCGVRGFSADGSLLLTQQGCCSGGRGRIVAVRTSGGESKDFLTDPDHDLWHAFFSWDDRWVVFKQTAEEPRAKLMIAPVRNGVAGDRADWISVTDGGSVDDKPQWSPDGNTIFFTSTRDGFLCVWAQRLEPKTKRTVGQPFPVQHFHDAQWWVSSRYAFRCELYVARDKIVNNLLGWSGDIWSMKLD